MLPSRLASKADYFAVWNRGLLGNKLRSWSRERDIPASVPSGVMLRVAQPGASYARVVPRRQVRAIMAQEPRWAGFWQFNEAAPDDHAILQGELFRGHDVPGSGKHGLCFFGSERRPEDRGKLIRMRDALKTARHYEGLETKLLLQRLLTPASLDDLLELLTAFNGHVIEFTAYDRCLGWAKGRNIIVWEVRAY